MTGFSIDWLALREPFDRAARSTRLAQSFVGHLPPRPQIVDLAGGTGANIRALAPAMRDGATWRLVDNDPRLLEAARTGLSALEVRCERHDISNEIDAAIGDAQAVTMSAFADLVSQAWIERFAAAVAKRRIPALIVLTVDGWHEFSPPHPDDDLVMAAFAQDQRRDKGFGPALGGNAVEYLAAAFRRVGYTVEDDSSDWHIGLDDGAMLDATIAGIADAAAAARPALSRRVGSWHAARRDAIAARRLTLRVGHRDLLAYPASRA